MTIEEDAKALMERITKLRKTTRIVQEIYETEKAFRNLVAVFVNTMETALTKLPEGSEKTEFNMFLEPYRQLVKNPLADQEMKETIEKLNTSLAPLRKLIEENHSDLNTKELIENTMNKIQENETIVENTAHSIKTALSSVSFEDFALAIHNYDSAVAFLTMFKKKNSDLYRRANDSAVSHILNNKVNFQVTGQKEPSITGIDSLLILPVQRGPRYVMLLAELEKAITGINKPEPSETLIKIRDKFKKIDTTKTIGSLRNALLREIEIAKSLSSDPPQVLENAKKSIEATCENFKNIILSKEPDKKEISNFVKDIQNVITALSTPDTYKKMHNTLEKSEYYLIAHSLAKPIDKIHKDFLTIRDALSVDRDPSSKPTQQKKHEFIAAIISKLSEPHDPLLSVPGNLKNKINGLTELIKDEKYKEAIDWHLNPFIHTKTKTREKVDEILKAIGDYQAATKTSPENTSPTTSSRSSDTLDPSDTSPPAGTPSGSPSPAPSKKSGDATSNASDDDRNVNQIYGKATPIIDPEETYTGSALLVSRQEGDESPWMTFEDEKETHDSTDNQPASESAIINARNEISATNYGNMPPAPSTQPIARGKENNIDTTRTIIQSLLKQAVDPQLPDTVKHRKALVAEALAQELSKEMKLAQQLGREAANASKLGFFAAKQAPTQQGQQKSITITPVAGPENPSRK